MVEDKEAPEAADAEADDAPAATELEAELRDDDIEAAAPDEVIVLELLELAPVMELDAPVAVLEAEEAQVAEVGREDTPAPPHND